MGPCNSERSINGPNASDKKFPYGSDKAIKGPHASDKKFPHGSDIAIKGPNGSDKGTPSQTWLYKGKITITYGVALHLNFKYPSMRK